MNEFIELQLRRNGRRVRILRQTSDGIELNEPDPISRTVGIGFDAASPVTRERMNSIRRSQGWDPGTFKVDVTVEDGSLVLRGVNQHALPAGTYQVQVQIEEARSTSGYQRAVVRQDGSAVVAIDIRTDDRDVAVDLSGADAGTLDVLRRSRLDGLVATDWLEDANRRPSRQACLLNLLASLRTRPTLSAPLLPLVRDVFTAESDRVYAKVDRSMLARLEALADDAGRPFYAEGRPHAGIHGRLLGAIPDPGERGRFRDLLSFRSEAKKGAPSMQIVIAVPPPELAHTYVDLDLDLGNPLQDVLGFLVHIGELIDGKPTNHLDLHKKLARTPARDFLCYSVLPAPG